MIKQESVEAKLRDAWKNSALNLGENAVNTNLARYEKSGQGGILVHENDWLTINSALDRANHPRGG